MNSFRPQTVEPASDLRLSVTSCDIVGSLPSLGALLLPLLILLRRNLLRKCRFATLPVPVLAWMTVLTVRHIEPLTGRSGCAKAGATSFHDSRHGDGLMKSAALTGRRRVPSVVQMPSVGWHGEDAQELAVASWSHTPSSASLRSDPGTHQTMGDGVNWDRKYFSDLHILLYRANARRNLFSRNYLRFLLFLSAPDHGEIETTT